jgi:hypothetical protein
MSPSVRVPLADGGASFILRDIANVDGRRFVTLPHFGHAGCAFGVDALRQKVEDRVAGEQ